MANRLKPVLAILATIVLALALSIAPFPRAALPFEPLWVALTVYYWTLALPEQFGVGYAWLTGLSMDELSGSLFGAHALALTFVAFIAARMHLKQRMYPLWQQSLGVGLALAVYAFTLFWITGIDHETTRPLTRFLPVLISMILWPWAYSVLRMVRRRYVHA